MPVNSIRGLADVLGVNESSIRRAEQSGRIVLERDANGNINVENARQQWNEIAKTTSTMPEQTSGVTYQKSKAHKEMYEALIKKMEYEEKSGKLVDRATVERDVFTSNRAVRDKLLLLPDRVAPILIGETDMHRFKEVLRKEIIAALQNVTDFLHGGGKS